MPPISQWWRFISTREFEEDWTDIGLDDEDRVRLETVLIHDPHAGDVIAGTDGLRKLRFARKGEGKSGGIRVCYAFFPDYGVVLFPLVYGKSRKKDLTAAEKKYFNHLLKQVRERL